MLYDVPEMLKGNIPVDGGNLIVEDVDLEPFIAEAPAVKKFLKPLVGAKEFLHNKKRWCLWLVDASPSELKALPNVVRRVEAVKKFRMASKKEATKKYAEYPTRFMEIRQPTTEYILIPSHSSESRKYIPIGFMSSDIISTNANLMLPNASMFHFGVMMSSIHMAWVGAVCGRLEMRYRYSNDIVYNNFPWPETTDAQKEEISKRAQGILDARALNPNDPLDALYDPYFMPDALRDAHKALDKAVIKAYGISYETDADLVTYLMQKYLELTKGKA